MLGMPFLTMFLVRHGNVCSSLLVRFASATSMFEVGQGWICQDEKVQVRPQRETPSKCRNGKAAEQSLVILACYKSF